MTDSDQNVNAKFDLALVIEHVELIHSLAAGIDGIIPLCVFEENAKPEVYHYFVGDSEDMIQDIMTFEMLHPRANLYIPWAIMRGDLPKGKKGSIADVTHVLAAVADLDADKGIRPDLPLDASYIVESSAGNLQGIYPFERPLTKEEAQPALDALCGAVGGDSGTKDCSHIWRIAGTLNAPSKAKIARGRPPAPQPVKIQKPFDCATFEAADLVRIFGAAKTLREARAPTRRPDPVPHTGSEERRLRSALATISSEDRDVWLRVGAALHATDWECARELWDEWSETSVKFDDADQDKTWNTFRTDRPNAVTVASIYALASEVGWKWEAGLEDAAEALESVEIVEAGEARKSATVRKSGIQMETMEGLQMEKVDWLWNGWLAKGKFHLIVGQPEAGKTTLGIAMMATISSGGLWPDGTRAEVGNCLIWSAEDSLADTIKPRLVAMGADLSRVFYINGQIGKDGKKRPFDPATDMTELAETSKNYPGGISFLLLDPVVSAIGAKTDSHKNSETRNALQPLLDFAEASRCAVLGVTHFSKGTAGRAPVDRVSGSLAFGALARVVMVASKVGDPDADSPRILIRAKSNIGASGGGFGYDLEPVTVGDGFDTTRVDWQGAIEGEAWQLLDAAEGKGEAAKPSALEEARQFLKARLERGEQPQSEITAAAMRAGIARMTLSRAAEEIVAKRKGGFAGKWFWSLKGATDFIEADLVEAYEVEEADEAGKPSKLEEARQFLNFMLSDGKRPKLEIEAEALKEGISSRTLKRAAEGIVAKRQVGYRGPWFWALANDSGTGIIEAKFH